MRTAYTVRREEERTGGDVETAVEELRVEFGHRDGGGRDGVGAVIGLLLYAGHVRNGALVEFANGRIVENVTALNLTLDLVGSTVARVDAHDIGQTLGVDNALGQRYGALLKETTDNLFGIGGVSSIGSDRPQSRGARQQHRPTQCQR